MIVNRSTTSKHAMCWPDRLHFIKEYVLPFGLCHNLQDSMN